MSITALQDYVFTSKYSRYIPEKLRRETFEEAVDRVIDMHRRHFAAKGIPVDDLLKICEAAMKNRLMLGSQRAMQFGGVIDRQITAGRYKAWRLRRIGL